MTPSIGDKIIAAIEEQELVFSPNGDGTVFFEIYAAQKLEAVVEAHIEERVALELEKYRKGFLEKL